MGTQSPRSQTSPLANKAIDWLFLLRSSRATQSDFAEFRAWRDADPAHEDAWQQLTSAIDGPAFEHINNNSSPTPPAIEPVSHNRRRLLAGIGLFAVGSGTLACVANTVYPLRHLACDAVTGTSERRQYTLSDGSKLLLDARSSANLSYTPSSRELNLQMGAATIQVSPNDPRPFRTVTNEGVIRTGGARYMVRQDSHRTLVVAHDAPVHIETKSGSRIVLEPGEGLRFDSVRVGDPSQDMATRAAWEYGRIVADGATLHEIVTALRPYHPGILRITMAAGGLPVHGEYSLDDVDGTLRSLEQNLPITVHRFTPWLRSIAVVPKNSTPSA